MQKRWIREGKTIFPSSGPVIANINLLREHFKAHGQPIFHVYITHASDGSDTRAGETTFNIEGTPDSLIIDELTPTKDEYLIPKTRLSAFFKTDLLKLLHAKNIRGVAVVGLELRACVMATYIDAYQNDFRPVTIISDAVLDGNQQYITQFLQSFRGEDFLTTTRDWISNAPSGG